MRLRPQPPAAHGGAAPAAIDLSASLNPLGPSPAALTAARAAELERYPEVDAGALAGAAARRHGVDASCVVPVAGAEFGLWLCAVAMLAPGDTCLAVGPCFGEYRRHAALAGADFRPVLASCPGAWPRDVLATALAGGPAMCVIGNPANPAGTVVRGAALRRLCAAHPDTRFVIDEAFAPFAPAGTSVLDTGPPPANAIVVRSLTKELGLPGLRMGYLVAPEATAAALAGSLPAWPLGASALAAAVAGMADTGHVEAGAALGRAHIERISRALAARGAGVVPSAVNYVLAHAPEVGGALLGRGIAVRDCASFGLAGHIRVAAPRPEQMDAVLEALADG